MKLVLDDGRDAEQVLLLVVELLVVGDQAPDLVQLRLLLLLPRRPGSSGGRGHQLGPPLALGQLFLLPQVLTAHPMSLVHQAAPSPGVVEAFHGVAGVGPALLDGQELAPPRPVARSIGLGRLVNWTRPPGR